MIKTLGVGLFVAIIGICLGARTRTVVAEDKVDCSKIQKWKDNHIYNQDELVVYQRTAEAGVEYKCNNGRCNNWPTGTGWVRVAECKPGTEPK